MTRYKVVLEYDGTDLIGWQENRQGPSVQSILSDAIFAFCGARPDIVGAGRTDAGVHAIGMVAHFDLSGKTDAETVKRALNFYLVNKPSSDEVAIIANDPQANFLPAYNWWNEYAETKVLPTSQLKAKNVLFDNFPTSLKTGQKVLAGIKAEFTNGMTWEILKNAD